MVIKVMIEKIKRDIEGEIGSFIEETRKYYKLNKIADLLFSGISDFLVRPGKRIRPVLYVLTYKGYTNKKNYSYKNLLLSSLSFEFLHDFLLVHDDVIDSSNLRRGKPTLHRLYNNKLNVSKNSKLGPGLAIVAGDVIFAIAIDVFLKLDESDNRKIEALRRFVETAAFTGAGEFIDIISGKMDVNLIKEEDVFLNYTMKTAKYTFEAPLSIGAGLAGVKGEELKKLSNLGIYMGQAFQILDDMSDIFLTRKEIGKPVLGDIDESKKTLLVFRTYKVLNSKDKTIFRKLFNKKAKTPGDIKRLKGYMDSTDSLNYCLSSVKLLLEKAEDLIDKLKMRMYSKEGLYDMVRDMISKAEKIGANK